ncbi:MAG: M48 family metallopeptidase [Myxococcales bacterium]|jgi:hypothetical protein|nr:M48 family metallopeptidase [Myxococcales bacterium]
MSSQREFGFCGATSTPARSAASPPDAPDLLDLEELPFILSEEERGLGSKDALQEQARQLAASFSAALGSPIRLTVTDNRSSMFSFRQPPGRPMSVRLHHMFLGAPSELIEDLVAFTRGGPDRKAASERIDRFIEENLECLRPCEEAFRPHAVHARGKFWDLQTIFDALNARFFGNRIAARIGWGRQPRTRNRKTIRLGVYDARSQTIRIHPALDQRHVPAYVIEFIVFHEMLHQAIPARERNGRQAFHGADFRREEQAFPDYERAMRWEKANVRKLIEQMPLRRRRGPTPPG